jgi:hypothetical protein
MVLVLLLLAGCGGGKTTMVVPDPSATIGLPTPATSGPVNTYSGAQSPGAWTLTLDNTKGVFSYQSTTYPATAVTGSTQVANGFTSLGTTGGYVLEVQGRAAILRPGGVTAPPVFAVPQTECYAITGRVRFPYVTKSIGPSQTVYAAGAGLEYGSIGASTDSTGKSWQFDDMAGTVVSGPTSFAGTCSTASNQTAISFTGQKSILNDFWAGSQVGKGSTGVITADTQSNIWVGPSGFFVADQSDPNGNSSVGQSTFGGSVAGVVEPSSALSTKDVASKKYLGFAYEAATANGAAPANTSPVAFGQVASSGTTITGGEFPSDDVTQSPNSDTVVNLGSQSATYNGFYPSVSITVLDPSQNCANYTGPKFNVTSGVNADGYITCTFPGIAVVGNPEGKYALFISTYNWATRLGGAYSQIYLFQQ